MRRVAVLAFVMATLLVIAYIFQPLSPKDVRVRELAKALHISHAQAEKIVGDEDQQVRQIMREYNCSQKEAQKILSQRRATERPVQKGH